MQHDHQHKKRTTHFSTNSSTASTGKGPHVYMVCTNLEQMSEQIVWFAGCDVVVPNDQRRIDLIRRESSITENNSQSVKKTYFETQGTKGSSKPSDIKEGETNPLKRRYII
jgi:hypothetical protein